MKRTKRILALILAFAMMLGSTSITAWADTGEATLPNNVSTESFGDSNTVAWTYEGMEGVDYATTLSAALTAAYMANKEGKQITIYCKPNADVGSMTHGHVEDNLVIYGNGAFVSSGERDLEVDQYSFSRETGKNTGNGPSFTKDVKIEVHNLGGIAIWGTRQSGYSLTAKFYNCSNMQRAYINGATGSNNLYFEGCSFDGSENAQLKANKGTTIYSNAPGSIEAVGCTFNEIYAAFNLNNKSTGKQTVKVTNCVFTNCGTNVTTNGENTYCAPVRVCVTKSANASTDLTVKNCTFSGTIGTNGDVLLGEGRTGKDNFQTVSLNMSGTSATAQLQSPGIAASTESNTLAQATADQTMKTNDGKNAFVVTTPAPEPQNFYEDDQGVWHIATAAGLVEFSNSVRNGNTYAGKTVKLDGNIDMTGVTYQSAGIGANTSKNFKGTFDGQKHTISNLTINGGNEDYTGLFCCLMAATVKDLTITEASVTGVRAGVLSGAAYGCTLDNITIKNSSVTGEQKCAGLLGFNLEGTTLTITNCEVKDTSINAANTTYSDVQGASFGGLVGFIHRDVNATITGNKVSGISFTGLLTQEFYDAHSTLYYQYLSHSFIGALMGIKNTANSADTTAILANNTVEKTSGLLTGPTTNDYLGFYYDETFATKPVTSIIIDGKAVSNKVVAQIGSVKYTSFEEAIADANADTNATAANPVVVELLADVDVTAAIMISNHVTLDGGNHIITTTANRGIRVDESGVSVTVKNLTITGSKMERAIQIDSNKSGIALTIDHVTATATLYTVNICAGTNNLNVKIQDSELNGWSAINSYASNSTFTITDSTLVGTNKYSSATNDYATIVFDGGTLAGLPGNSASSTLTITDCVIIAKELGTNKQSWISFQYGASNNEAAVVSVSGTSILDDVNGNDKTATIYMTGIGNKITIALTAEQKAALEEQQFVVTENGDKYDITIPTPDVFYSNGNTPAQAEENGFDTFLAMPYNSGWMANGEWVTLKKNIVLTSAVTANFAGTGLMYLGEYTLTLGEGGSFVISNGTAIKTDKQVVGVFSAPAGYKVVETDNGDNTYTYSVEETSVAQIGDVSYNSVEDAIEVVEANQEITIVEDTTVAGVAVSSGDTVTVATGTASSAGEEVTVTPKTLTITKDEATQIVVAYVVADGDGSSLVTDVNTDDTIVNDAAAEELVKVADVLAAAVNNNNDIAAESVTKVVIGVDADPDTVDLENKTVSYDVDPYALISRTGEEDKKITLTNSDLASGAVFVFRLDVTAIAQAGDTVAATHKSGSINYGTQNYEAKAGANNTVYIEITTSHFSTWDLALVSSSFESTLTGYDYHDYAWVGGQNLLMLDTIQHQTYLYIPEGLNASYVTVKLGSDAAVTKSLSDLAKDSSGNFYVVPQTVYAYRLGESVEVMLYNGYDEQIPLYVGRNNNTELWTLKNGSYTTTVYQYLDAMAKAYKDLSDTWYQIWYNFALKTKTYGEAAYAGHIATPNYREMD